MFFTLCVKNVMRKCAGKPYKKLSVERSARRKDLWLWVTQQSRDKAEITAVVPDLRFPKREHCNLQEIMAHKIYNNDNNNKRWMEQQS